MSTEISASSKSEALASVEKHPLHTEAVAWPYCMCDVFLLPKAFISRIPISDLERSEILAQLAGVEAVIAVSYYTANKEPEPLSGAGKTYNFLVHPNSFSVLRADIGTWRS